MEKPIAQWNSEMQVWEKIKQNNLFSAPSEPYVATFPTSGTVRDGRLWQHQRLVPRTAASASSSSPRLSADDDHQVFPTPMARDHRPGSPAEMQRHSPGLSSIDALLPTPDATNGARGTRSREALVARGVDQHGKRLDRQVNLDDISALLPTPKASDHKSTDSEVERRRNTPNLPAISFYYNVDTDPRPVDPSPQPTVINSSGDEQYVLFPSDAGAQVRESEPTSASPLVMGASLDLLPTPVTTDAKSAARGTTTTGVMHAGTSLTDAIRSLPSEPVEDLLPTPAAADGKRGPDFARANRAGSGGDDLITLAVKASQAQQWGKYGPAVARWEMVTRPSPSPTEPNRNGNARLTAAFSEWLLGWPAGWVTDPEIGLARTGQLRLIGNGVVPQQAVAALTMLLDLMKDEQNPDM